jgi:Tfp pilus assembly protein PilN
MIDINLVPEQLRKRRKSELLSGGIFNIPKEVMVGVGGGIIVLLLAIDVLFFLAKVVKFAQYHHAKSQWEAILPDKTNTDAIKKELQDLQKEVKSMKDIMEGHNAVWSQKLNVISDALPKGIWLRKITLNDKQLFIEGTTVSKEQNEMTNVGNFVSNLKKDEEFMKNFESIEVDYIQRRKNDTLEVADFTILARLK